MNGIVKRRERRAACESLAGWRQMDHPEYDAVAGVWNRSVRRHPVTLDKPSQRKVRARPARVTHAGRLTHTGKAEFRAVPRTPVKVLRRNRRMRDEYLAAVERQA